MMNKMPKADARERLQCTNKFKRSSIHSGFFSFMELFSTISKPWDKSPANTGLCSSGMPFANASCNRSGAVSPAISRAGRSSPSNARKAEIALSPERYSRNR